MVGSFVLFAVGFSVTNAVRVGTVAENVIVMGEEAHIAELIDANVTWGGPTQYEVNQKDCSGDQAICRMQPELGLKMSSDKIGHINAQGECSKQIAGGKFKVSGVLLGKKLTVKPDSGEICSDVHIEVLHSLVGKVANTKVKSPGCPVEKGPVKLPMEFNLGRLSSFQRSVAYAPTIITTKIFSDQNELVICMEIRVKVL